MILHLGDVLDAQAVVTLSDALQDRNLFQDGKLTAGQEARKVKENLQARSSEQTAARLRTVEQAMLAHPVFKSAARPKRIVKVLFSRYEPGMSYGTHVDNAVMAGTRTDLSFTLFLSDPDTYEGGELFIEGLDRDRHVKLPAGSAVVYPTNALHRVEPVTSGVRLAAVGWVRSFIRDPGRREVLFDLDQAIAALPEGAEDQGVRNRLHKVRSSLIRLWVDD